MNSTRLVETDAFPFEFISQLAERESWRKEVHRPVYHLHKWWAKRLGSVFRGILLGGVLPENADLATEFYRTHSFPSLAVFDPFMGSGTTVGEAHKLGLTALGRDINPVACESVRVALGPMDRRRLIAAYNELSESVGRRIRALYRSKDSRGRPCDVLYYFWVMQVVCTACHKPVDLFPSWIVARNAYPRRKPEIQVRCPSCGDIFQAMQGQGLVNCRTCSKSFDPREGIARGAKAACRECGHSFTILDAVAATEKRPEFRLYGKLVLTSSDGKEYLAATEEDQESYCACSRRLNEDETSGRVMIPSLALESGYNTRQAMNYAFTTWRDFFNDRQLLALGWLRGGIDTFVDSPTRDALLMLFSGVLEFNNLFASYKGEGTGAVRHMFSHHILKPERTPIEANVWGTRKSSGSFQTLFRSRLLRTIDYRLTPTEVNERKGGHGVVCAEPFTGEVETVWPTAANYSSRKLYLSCGDSASTGLQSGSIDLVVTDPPFFDNVHYSELADFFYAWQQLRSGQNSGRGDTTRSPHEVQDSDARHFAFKLQNVFRECCRVIKDDGLLVFTYHHSRDEGWRALASALLGAGFVVVNAQPVKAEMSVATPKSQAKEPIQLDIIIVCRKQSRCQHRGRPSAEQALASAKAKLGRLRDAGLCLSRNDRRIVALGQLLTTLRSPDEALRFGDCLTFDAGPEDVPVQPRPSAETQLLMFDGSV